MRSIAAVILLLATSCQAANLPSRAGHGHFSASITSAQLSVSADGRSGSVDLGPGLFGAFIESSQVIFSARTDRGIFFVIDFINGSARNDDGGNCGRGIEENLVWVAFDPLLRPINTTSELIASCLQRIDMGAGIQQNARSISVRFDSYSEHTRRFLFFRKAAPQLGFAIQESSLPDNGDAAQ